MKIDIELDQDYMQESLAMDVKKGFGAEEKYLNPKWFYDETGSKLFEDITRLKEYYPTRAEDEILRDKADEIAQITQADNLVELGSGNSEKTHALISALRREDGCRLFVPFDVSEDALRESTTYLKERYEDMEIHGVVGDFDRHLDSLPDEEGKSLIIFLGGTIGNFNPQKRESFLGELSELMNPGDYLLLGTDLVKEKRRLLDAYNDQAGATEKFNLNVLNVINRELNGNIDAEQFYHSAEYNEDKSRIEMYLVSKSSQSYLLEGLDMEVEFEEGEKILTEISTKFSPGEITEEITQAGLSVVNQWTDNADDFMVTLAECK